ncbi:MAG TPA: hypothetical protein VMF67_11115 [Rhizomicrobium sp.]|nr:hypothetical protein [Rhizomicrobium sp.]
MAHEALKISDVAFVVSSQIERAPHWTMIRELTMNAVEAAARADGEKIVHWTSAPWRGMRKAVIWNTGPGMDAAALKAATDLACELNKSLGLDENFGVGAKVSSLASNRLGMRFRSCKLGRVSEVILGYDPETKLYVRFARHLPGGIKDTVIDVTETAKRDGKKTDFDWTEVMLLGNSEDQDTSVRPFAAEATEKAYVATALYRRFYRLPEGVKLVLDANYHRLGGIRVFTPVGQRFGKFRRTQSVRVRGAQLVVHYLHDPPAAGGHRASSSGALGSSTTTCCLVHRNEMYSVMTGNEWSAAAPRFGIAFGSKELCVHIELDDEAARPTQYRERLISRLTGADILPQDFAIAVRENMPAWVKEVIRHASPRRLEDYDDLRKELQELLNRYKVRMASRRPDRTTGVPSAPGGGVETAASGMGAAGLARTASGERRRFHETPDGAAVTSLYEITQRAPRIIMLEQAEDIAEKGLKGRAAEFIPETGELFVNGLYEAVERMVSDLAPEFAGQADEEMVRRVVTSVARRTLALRVGKATVFALAKRASEDWEEEDMLAALAKESLSIAADNYEESHALARRRIREALKIEKAVA